MKQPEHNTAPGSTDISSDSLTPEERMLIMSWREKPELSSSLSRLLDLPADFEK